MKMTMLGLTIVAGAGLGAAGLDAMTPGTASPAAAQSRAGTDACTRTGQVGNLRVCVLARGGLVVAVQLPSRSDAPSSGQWVVLRHAGAAPAE